MNVVIAIDSFKGSLTSLQAGNAVKEAIQKLDNDSIIRVLPLADGGEGTVEALSLSSEAYLVTAKATDPLGMPIDAKYCILKDKKTAVIEMASAAGLTLVPVEKRNPMNTSTYGVGQLIKDAIHKGCRHFIIGIGGSATNDGGTGMLSALGFEFLDTNNAPIPLGAKGLELLNSISINNVLPELKDCTFRIACDVSNPLCGPNGCSYVFATQKGATHEMIEKMDKWLNDYSALAHSISSKADKNHQGAGAAGGLGFAFLTFMNSTLESGINIILDEIGLEEHIKNTDIVVTGEGKLDSQTIMGKAPIGVAALAKKYGKKVIAFSGCIADDAEVCNDYGIDAFFSITPGAMSLQEAMNEKNAYKNLKNTALQVFRLVNI